jgi:hypothetical protein
MQIAIPDGWLRSIVLMRLVYSPSNSSAEFGGLRVCCVDVYRSHAAGTVAPLSIFAW